MALPSWVVTLLVSILLVLLTTVFYAGSTFSQVNQMRERLDRIERLLDRAPGTAH